MPKKAEIGRMTGDEPYKSFGVTDNATIGDLLSKANLSLGSGEEINDDCSNAVSPNDLVRDGETYHIVTGYKNGSF